MDLRIAVPAEQADEFKASLFHFLERLTETGQDGFAVHSVEPAGNNLIQHVYFESDQAAAEFSNRWTEGRAE